ncbi:MAG: RDD family protein [Thermomicrobiales bacterium]
MTSDLRISPPSLEGKGVPSGQHGGLGFPPPITTADIPDAVRITTPEQVTITLPLAGVGTRLLAALLDALVMIGVILIALIVIALIGSLIALQPHGVAAGSVLSAFALLFLFGFVFAYYAGLELLWDGQTIGKRVLKLRVLRDNGTPVDAAAVLARTVVRLVDFLPFGYLVGLISMIVDGRARRLGDIVGGTIVVREWDSAPTLREIASGAEPAAWGPPAPGQEAPVSLLTTDELAAAREFLRRAATFPPPERAALAWRVATTLAARIGYSESLTHPEWFLIWIVRNAATQGD